jgi:hypothetical protein
VRDQRPSPLPDARAPCRLPVQKRRRCAPPPGPTTAGSTTTWGHKQERDKVSVQHQVSQERRQPPGGGNRDRHNQERPQYATTRSRENGRIDMLPHSRRGQQGRQPSDAQTRTPSDLLPSRLEYVEPDTLRPYFKHNKNGRLDAKQECRPAVVEGDILESRHPRRLRDGAPPTAPPSPPAAPATQTGPLAL